MDNNDEKQILCKALAPRLRNLRVLHRLSQKEMAEKVGVTQVDISLWESRKQLPTLISIKKVIDAFSLPWGFFNPDDQALIPYPTAIKQLLGVDYLREIDMQINSGADQEEVQAQAEEVLRKRHRILP